MTAPSTPAGQDAELREHVAAMVASKVGSCRSLVDAIVAWHKSELSRADGERAQAAPGAECTVDEYVRETSDEYRAWRDAPEDCGFGPPMEEADRLVDVESWILSVARGRDRCLAQVRAFPR